MRKILLHCASAFLLLPAFSYAQLSWTEKPAMHEVPKEFAQESLIFMEDARELNYKFDSKTKDFFLYRTIHRIVKLQDEKGLEAFNKMVIGPSRSGEIVDLKARTIKANGKVYEIKKSDTKTSKDEYGNTQYHVAFENVAVGDEIEFIYEEKRAVNSFGSELFQFGIPTVSSSFVLSTPDHIKFDCKGYNGFPTPVFKEDEQGKTATYKASFAKIDALKDEKYADPDPNAKRIDYKISYINDGQRANTWADLAKGIYTQLYTPTEKEQKALEKYIKSLNITVDMPVDQRIIKLEKVIKEQFVVNEELTDEAYERLDYMIEKKTTTERGIFKLFANAFDLLQVKHEAGITANRFKYELDEEMELWNYLDIYIFHFPETKKFLLPTATTMRYPALGAYVEGNKALFCKRVSLGGVTSSVQVFREVPRSKIEDNITALVATVNFNEQDLSPQIKMSHSFTGASSVGMRENVTLVPKEKEKELVKALMFVADEESDILSYQFNNKGLEHYTDNKPVEIVAEIKADKLIEKAGSKYLFKLGDIIGPQMEMYREEKRILPISIAYPHVLKREIIVHVPQGYKVSNPNAADFKVTYGQQKYGFISSHSMKGNVLTVVIEEFYAQPRYDAAEVEDFRKVINASADFNKVTLVLEKI